MNLSKKNVQSNMLDFDDTFFKQTNLDEIELEILNEKTKSKTCHGRNTSSKNWKALSLSSQRSDQSSKKTVSGTEKTKSSDNNSGVVEILSNSNDEPDCFAFLRKTDLQSSILKFQADNFTQLCNSTQVVKQIEEDIFQSELEHNLPKKRRKSVEGEDVHTEKSDPFSFLMEDSQNTVVSQKDANNKLNNVQDFKANSSIHIEEDVKEFGLEDKVVELLKSSHYRQELTQLFDNLEHSICHNQNLTNDSMINEHMLSKFTQDTNKSIGSIIKNVMKDNINASLSSKGFVNTTLLSGEATFNELGTFYGLPNKVTQLIKVLKGIDELYDWQIECLNLPAIKLRKNLIYSLPTSGGKTLVAEILILREVLCRKRNAIFVLPYVSIVQEKVWSLSSFAVEFDFLVEEYAAGKGSYPPRKRRHKNSVYVATTEKALGIVNSLIEKERLNELGLVVVDEMHLIGDSHRGPVLEALLTKLMFITDKVHIVGMSATIGNLNDISQFLNADVYKRNFRPIELIEYVKCGSKIAKVNLNANEDAIFEISRTTNFDYSDKMRQIDPDCIGGLVTETIPDGSCLVFCPTKKNCENVAKLLCKVLNGSTLRNYKSKEKLQLLKALRNDAGTVCQILKQSVPFGIAYHHSGLTGEERKLIEEAYRTGILCVICCTSTLAAGVNLPAKRVIIRKPYIAQEFISLSRYKQMIGRAGRAGLGEVGESILICTEEDTKKVQELFTSPMDQTLSKLHEDNCSHLMHLFLSCIGLRTANTKEDLKKVLNKTLLAVQQDKLEVTIETLLRKAIKDLIKQGAVQVDPVSDCTSFNSSVSTVTQQGSGRKKKTICIDSKKNLTISKLGNAAMKGNLNLRDAHVLYADLAKAKESLVLVNCLHLLYLLTPYGFIEQIHPEKNQFHSILLNMGNEERKTANVLGITDSCIVRMFSNQQITSVPEKVLNRFYLSLMLYELWNEASIIDVSEKYQVNRGIVQNLMTSAATFSTNVVTFCEQLDEFWAFVYLLKGMSQRLAHCCCKDLLPLMELPAVKQARAKQLFQAGFRNLQSIAKADSQDLMNAIEFLPRRVANQLIAAAKMLLLEKVENLREEAEDVLDGIDQK